MAIRGEIVVECDRCSCEAELVLAAPRTRTMTVSELIWDHGWRIEPDGTFTCEQCVEEADAAQG